MHVRSRGRIAEIGQIRTANRSRPVLILAVPALSLVVPALAVALASTGGTSQLARASAAVARFLLSYSGVFALVALTAAVAAGLLATDHLVMSPQRRILAQALHRTMSLVGIAALANHIMLEILAHRARIIDGFVPFMAARSTFYMGLGTLASDLFIVIIITGILRRRFARGAGRVLWRALHATAYAAWPLAILHGLLAGRSARPYVDWSYGACVAAVGLALVLRYLAAIRGRTAAADAGGPASHVLPRRPVPAQPLGQHRSASRLPAGQPRALPAPQPASPPQWYDRAGARPGMQR